LWNEPGMNVGFRVLREIPPVDGTSATAARGEPAYLVRRGEPLSSKALVPHPAPVAGLRSWSVELRAPAAGGSVGVVAAQQQRNLVTTGSSSGKISVWDENGKLQQVLLGHQGGIYRLEFSADGKWLASCDRYSGPTGSTARVWEIATGRQAAVFPVAGWCWGARFSPDGRRLAVGAGGGLLLWDRTTQNVTSHSRVQDLVTLAWTADSRQIIGSHGFNKLRFYDVATMEVLRESNCPVAHDMQISPDGRWLALRSPDGQVDLREMESLTLARTLAKEGAGPSAALAWLPDSRRIAVAWANALSAIYDTTTGAEELTFPLPGYAIAIRADGGEAVFNGGGGPLFADTSTGRLLLRQQTMYRFDHPTHLAPDGREVWVAVGGDLVVHDAESGARLRSFPVAVGGEFAWMNMESAGGGQLALYQVDRPYVPLIDPGSGQVIRTLEHGSVTATCAAWSPDGKVLATAGADHHLRLWNIETGTVEHLLKGHTDRVPSLAWSPEGRRLASVGDDLTLRIWEAASGTLVATFDKFPENLTMAPTKSRALAWIDEHRLWIALTNNVAVLDLETLKFGPLENFSQGNIVSRLTLSPNRRRLLTHEDYDFTLLREGEGSAARRLLGHALGGGPRRLHAWHPDNRRFLSNRSDSGTQAYDAERRVRLGLLFPQIETIDPTDPQPQRHWLCIGPTGHIRGGPCDVPANVAGEFPGEGNTTQSVASIADLIVYVALHDDGSQRTYTPAEFARKFAWQNDPNQATLLKLDE
jgi:WD40 repeat protein